MTHRGEEEGSGPWLRGAACAGDEEEDDMRLSRSSAAAADSTSFAKCYSFSQREGCVRTYAWMVQRVGLLIEGLKSQLFLKPFFRVKTS